MISLSGGKMLKIIRSRKALSLQDLKRLFCDHSDNMTIGYDKTAAYGRPWEHFRITEKFCLVCGHTLEISIKRKHDKGVNKQNI